jgi:hypothetical protein
MDITESNKSNFGLCRAASVVSSWPIRIPTPSDAVTPEMFGLVVELEKFAAQQCQGMVDAVGHDTVRFGDVRDWLFKWGES